MIHLNYNILKRMGYKTGMWTGNDTLESISIYLNGYTCALEDNNLIDKIQPDPFHDWIADKLGFGESTAGWVNMILAVTIGLNPKSICWNDFDSKVTKDIHRDSIKIFYKLVEEYINEIL